MCQKKKKILFNPEPAPLVPHPALTIPFPVKRFSSKLAPRVPSNILKNPPFYSFYSLVTPFNENIRILKSLNNSDYVTHFFI